MALFISCLCALLSQLFQGVMAEAMGVEVKDVALRGATDGTFHLINMSFLPIISRCHGGGNGSGGERCGIWRSWPRLRCLPGSSDDDALLANLVGAFASNDLVGAYSANTLMNGRDTDDHGRDAFLIFLKTAQSE